MRRTSRAPRLSAALASRRAFTLVEMLVVIAIILVLSSILLPGMSAVRETAKSTKCLANLRQIGNAITAYATDNNECLVPGDYFGKVDGGVHLSGGSWADILAQSNYLPAPMGKISQAGETTATFDDNWDMDNVFRCPNGSADNVLNYHFPVTQTDPCGGMFFARASEFTLNAVRTWYAVNMCPRQEAQNLPQLPFGFLPDITPATAKSGAMNDYRLNRLPNLPHPSRLPLVYDGVWMIAALPAFTVDPTKIHARHNFQKSTNLLFADMHCESQLTASLPNSDWYME